MNYLVGFLSPYLIAFVAALLIAHIIKYIIDVANKTAVDPLHQLFMTGGMPSAHAATVMSVWVVILLKDGPSSGLFGLATVLAAIILLDAIKVRRSSGEQGLALTALIKEQDSKVHLPRVAQGHTPLQVAVGTLIGLAIGVLVCVFVK